MCAGTRFRGTFQNCTFRSSSVYSVHGATITLRRCRVRSSHPGLTASGGATSATIVECSFQRCFTSVAVEQGAEVAVHTCFLRRSGAAVTVHGLRSHASLDSCELSGAVEDGCGHTGIAARGGSALLRSCVLSGFHTGALGIGSTTSIELHRTVVTGGSTSTVVLMRGARALGRACRLSVGEGLCAGDDDGPDSDDEDAAVVVGASPGSPLLGNARMQLEQSSVFKQGGRGVAVADGSMVDMYRCEVEASREAVYSVFASVATLTQCIAHSQYICLAAEQEGAKVSLIGGCYVGSSTACLVKESAVVTAVDCELRGLNVPEARGVVTVAIEAEAWLLRCHVHGGVSGVMAAEATVHAVDTIVSDVLTTVPQQCGPRPEDVRVSGGAGYFFIGGRATVRSGRVERCVLGLEVQSERGRDGGVTAEEVQFVDCVVAMEVIGHSEVDMTRCDFKGPRRDRGSVPPADLRNDRYSRESETGVAFRGHKRGSVTACTFVGYVHSAVVTSQGGVVISGTSFTVAGECAWGVLGTGVFTVEGCAFVGVGEGPKLHGVKTLKQAECVIRSCSMEGLRGESVQADMQSSVRVLETVISCGGAHGLVVSKEASLAAQDCQLSVSGTGVRVEGGVFSGKRVSIDAGRTGLTADPPPDTVAEVKLVDSKVDGGHIGVCGEGPSLDLSLLRCHVLDCCNGVVLRGGASARVKGSQVVECQVGVQVGDSGGDLAAECCVCGRRGDRARRDAVRVLSEHRGATVAGAACAHTGAVTHARMEDVEVIGCGHDGVVVHPHGHVRVDGALVWGCGTGYRMHYVAVRSEFRRCKAVECDTGAVALQRSSTDVDYTLPAGPIPEIEVYELRLPEPPGWICDECRACD